MTTVVIPEVDLVAETLDVFVKKNKIISCVLVNIVYRLSAMVLKSYFAED